MHGVVPVPGETGGWGRGLEGTGWRGGSKAKARKGTEGCVHVYLVHFLLSLLFIEEKLTEREVNL